MSYEIVVNGELYHHGILGQKWGVRRYQNADGTLTAKGRKRYGVDLDSSDKSHYNTAKIKLGKARKEYDDAKINKAGFKKVVTLKLKERKVKNSLEDAKIADKGEKLLAKGYTQKKEEIKKFVGYGAAYATSYAMKNFLSKRLIELDNEGRLTLGHLGVAGLTTFGTTVAALAGAGIYRNKKQMNQQAMNLAQGKPKNQRAFITKGNKKNSENT